MRVLFHVDEIGRWKLALTNVENMLRYGGEHGVPVKIEVVANGPAVTALTPEGAAAAGIAGQLEAAAQSGVRICACRNALRANRIPPEALPGYVQTVPAGVVELALRQEEGYSYIKP